ncbi:MAG: HAD family hydrolase [Acidimicrobiia bacterium]
MHGASHRRAGPEAVLFDLDDTLIDWWGSISTCLAELTGDEISDALLAHCREQCWELDPTGSHVWHRNTWAMHTRIDELWPAALPFVDPGELELLQKLFVDELWVGFFPDTLPTLDALLDRIRLGVLSNNHHLPDEVDRLRLHDWFEAAVHTPPEQHKPHRGAFELGARAMRLPPERCIYVGDSIKADALGAHAAGMTAVWLDRWDDGWTNRPREIHRITSLTELPDLLTQLGA